MADVRLDIEGEGGDAIRAIAELKSALKTLRDETVKVTVKTKDQRKAAQLANQATVRQAAAAADSAVQIRSHTRATVGGSKALTDLRKVMGDLTREMRILNRTMARTVDKTNESFKDLRKTMRGLKVDFKDGITVQKNLVQVTKQVTGATGKATKEIDKNTKRVMAANVAYKTLSSTAKTVRHLMPDLGRKGIRPLNLLIGASALGVVALGNQLMSLAGILGAMPAVLGGLGGMGVALASADFGEVPKALEKLDEIQKKLNVSTKTGEERVKELAKAEEQRRLIMLGLNRAQRQAIPFFREMEQLGKEVTREAQEGLAPALASVGRILERNRGLIRGFVGDGARNVSRGAGLAERLLNTKGAQKDLAELRRQANVMGGALIEAAVRFGRAFMAIGAQAKPLIRFLAGGLDDVSKRFMKWATSKKGRQEITDFFEDSIRNLKLFGSILGNVAGALGNFFDAAEPTGDTFLQWLDRVTGKLERWSGSFDGQKDISEFFGAVGTGAGKLRDLATHLPGVVDGLGGLADRAQGLGDKLSPFFRGLENIASVGGRLVGWENFFTGLAALKVGQMTGITAALGGLVGNMAQSSGKVGALGRVLQSAPLWAAGLGLVAFGISQIGNNATQAEMELNDLSGALGNVLGSASKMQAGTKRFGQIQFDKRGLELQIRQMQRDLKGLKPGTLEWEIQLNNIDQAKQQLRDLNQESDTLLRDLKAELAAGEKHWGAWSKEAGEAIQAIVNPPNAGKGGAQRTLQLIQEEAKRGAGTFRDLAEQAREAGDPKAAETFDKMAQKLDLLAGKKIDPKVDIKHNMDEVQGEAATLRSQLLALEDHYTATFTLTRQTISVDLGGQTPPRNPTGGKKTKSLDPTRASVGPRQILQAVAANTIESFRELKTGIPLPQARNFLAIWRQVVKWQEQLKRLNRMAVTDQQKLNAATKHLAAVWKEIHKDKKVSEEEEARLERAREQVASAREKRDRTREAIEAKRERIAGPVVGRMGFENRDLGLQARIARNRLADQWLGGGGLNGVKSLLRDQFALTAGRFSQVQAFRDKGGLNPAAVRAANEELVDLAGALQAIQEEVFAGDAGLADLASRWGTLTGASDTLVGTMNVAGEQMKIFQQMLQSNNSGLGFTAEQVTQLAEAMRGLTRQVLDARLAEIDAGFTSLAFADVLAKGGANATGIYGSGINNETAFAALSIENLIRQLGVGGEMVGGVFQAYTPSDIQAIQSKVVQLFELMTGNIAEWTSAQQQTADNTAEIAENTSNLNEVAEEALRALGIARLEGVVFTRQMAILQEYLQGQVGKFASGTSYVHRTGTAVVHRGEEIRPKSRSTDSSSTMQPMQLTIRGTDKLTRAIAEALTPEVDTRLGRRARTVARGGA